MQNIQCEVYIIFRRNKSLLKSRCFNYGSKNRKLRKNLQSTYDYQIGNIIGNQQLRTVHRNIFYFIFSNEIIAYVSYSYSSNEIVYVNVNMLYYNSLVFRLIRILCFNISGII